MEEKIEQDLLKVMASIATSLLALEKCVYTDDDGHQYFRMES
jgi:hypothetical protein